MVDDEIACRVESQVKLDRLCQLEPIGDGLNESIIGRTINSQFRQFPHAKMLKFWTAFEPQIDVALQHALYA